MPSAVPADLIARAQIIAGLRQLADYLDANPGVPVNEYGWDLNIYTVHGGDAAQRAEIDQVAAVLGVAVQDETGSGGHYSAERTFGRITYRCVHISERRRAEHRAFVSYAGAVTPDDLPAPAEAA
jgi:hypothetical protein